MKVIGFIGGYDKIDLIIYIAKILTIAKKKILVVDASLNQKARYIVPTINPTKTFVTNFEGIDFAVGFDDFEGISEYLGIDKNEFEYDYTLVNIDSSEAFQSFKAENNFQNCFVTSFDVYSLKKGVEILSQCNIPIRLLKIFLTNNMLKEENEYLEYLAKNLKIKWDDNIVNIPLELENYSVTVEDQIISRIRLKKLSGDYKASLEFLIKVIFDKDITSKEISNAFKIIERET